MTIARHSLAYIKAVFYKSNMELLKLDKSILDGLIQNKPVLIETDHLAFCLVKKEIELYAFQQKCPHAGADLCDGFVDALGNVVCPLHHYKFNIVNGRNVTGEGYFLRRYKVEQRGDDFFIMIP